MLAVVLKQHLHSGSSKGFAWVRDGHLQEVIDAGWLDVLEDVDNTVDEAVKGHGLQAAAQGQHCQRYLSPLSAQGSGVLRERECLSCNGMRCML